MPKSQWRFNKFSRDFIKISIQSPIKSRSKSLSFPKNSNYKYRLLFRISKIDLKIIIRTLKST